jgi:hypothetical protein
MLSLSFGLLAAGLSACSGTTSTTRPIERDTSLKVVSTAIVGSPTWNNPRPSPSPILVLSNSGAGSSGQNGNGNPSSSNAAGGFPSIPDLRSAADRQRLVVVDGTDGFGAWLRSDPAGDPVRVWPDGSPMLVVGTDREAQGRTWRNVMTIDGGSGWMASDYLAPIDPAMVAAALGPAPATAAPPPEPNLPRATPTPSAPAPTPTKTPGSQAARLPAATAIPTATAGAASAATSQSTPIPTIAASTSATPIRAGNGVHTFKVGDLTLTMKSMVRSMAIQIGNRPRPGMELVGVEIDIANEGDAAAAIYRSSFRLALADGSRLEPLNGQEPAFAYLVDLPVSHELEGWLTFEVPKGAAIDSLQWSPDRGATYALSTQ